MYNAKEITACRRCRSHDSRYLEIDPTILRIVAALLVIFSVGGIILAYFIMAIIMPKEVL